MACTLHLPNGLTVTVSPVFGGFSFTAKELDVHHSACPPGWSIMIGRTHNHRYSRPSVQDDHLYMSSISNPSTADFKPSSSPTREIAMMLWVTLWWYFHQPTPDEAVDTVWKVWIERDGIFKSRKLFPKLERMGLIASDVSSLASTRPDGWDSMFVGQSAFWQIDPRIFLFTLAPAHASPFPASSPLSSRSSSPNRIMGPFASNSHLPTYYPPAPPQYTLTDGTRHPLRSRPPASGQTIYTRWIPSFSQTLSFRAATDTDVGLLHKWMNEPRVAAMWGAQGDMDVQRNLLSRALTDNHSFPVVGCWDDKPFGYFEIYWVREDALGKLLPSDEDHDYDRGLHVLVGEQEFRGPHRVRVWLSALVHVCWLADLRTSRVMLEPRIDNTKFLHYLDAAGFCRVGEITFPHKQAILVQTTRDRWQAPTL